MDETHVLKAIVQQAPKRMMEVAPPVLQASTHRQEAPVSSAKKESIPIWEAASVPFVQQAQSQRHQVIQPVLHVLPGRMRLTINFAASAPLARFLARQVKTVRFAPQELFRSHPVPGPCDACPAGKYEVNSQLCSNCPAGSISGGSSSTCTRCQAGFQAPKPGSVACQPCPAGTYAVEAGARCSVCPSGSISGVASGACSQCNAGHFAKAAVSCEPCPAGTHEVDNQFCSECPPGKISGPASQNCSVCPAGTVSKSSGSWSCDACPAGKYEVNSQLCSNCPAGSISGGSSSTCTRCQAGFQAPKPGSVACQPCPAGTYAVEAGARCSVCPSGSISGVASGARSQCNAGHFAKAAVSCEPCPAGTFAGRGSSMCQGCPLGHVSSQNSAACRSCESSLIQMTPDATNQTCEVVAMHIVFALISWATSACLALLFLTGCFSRLPIADVSAQGQKVVLTTSMPHYHLKWACTVAIFTDTGVPDLESSSRIWRVKPLSVYQMTLHGDDSTMQLETSTGHVHIGFPYFFLSAGVWRCPLTLWCLLFFAAAAGTASQLTWSLAMVVCGSSLCTGAFCFALRRRWGHASSVSFLLACLGPGVRDHSKSG